MERKDSMNIAFLSVGGNLGDRLENIAAAEQAIRKVCGRITKSSGIYETEPWGSTSGKNYLNRVVRLETALDAEQLLKKTMEIEQLLGRKRSSRYADRTMDIDILFFNGEVINEKHLQVPHPRLHLRNFVLIPLHEIEKKLVHPVLKKTISTLLKASKDELKAIPYRPAPKPRYICIEGNIGSGKSTLARALAKKFKATLISEKFDKNPLLPMFYENPKTYAFPLEMSFLLERFRQLSGAALSGKKQIICDFSFYKSLWFAEANLPDKAFKQFRKQFKALATLLPEPDLVIYLDTSLTNLRDNIQKRSRPYELNIKDAYLKQLAKKYKLGLSQLDGKQLVIHIKAYHPGLEKESIRTIENYIKENFGRKNQKAYI